MFCSCTPQTHRGNLASVGVKITSTSKTLQTSIAITNDRQQTALNTVGNTNNSSVTSSHGATGIHERKRTPRGVIKGVIGLHRPHLFFLGGRAFTRDIDITVVKSFASPTPGCGIKVPKSAPSCWEITTQLSRGCLPHRGGAGGQTTLYLSASDDVHVRRLLNTVPLSDDHIASPECHRLEGRHHLLKAWFGT